MLCEIPSLNMAAFKKVAGFTEMCAPEQQSVAFFLCVKKRAKNWKLWAPKEQSVFTFFFPRSETLSLVMRQGSHKKKKS